MEHKIIEGDFRDAKIEHESVDLILTDPPYPKEYLSLWKDLSEFAFKVLKPSKFLITYSGEMYLPYVIDALSKNLIYYWTFALIHRDSTQIVNERNIICGWKPILVFQKPPFKMIDTHPKDVIIGTGSKEVIPIIRRFTNEKDNILDPFAGSGTTLEAAYLTGRNSISIEIDQNNVKIIKQRLRSHTSKKTIFDFV